ncbi:MAG: YIP1 family protein, partial [Anaerolineales bacterium]
ALLDSRRGLPGTAPKPERPPLEQVNAWALPTLSKGIGKVNEWLGLAARAITLDRAAYRQVAVDAFMTGPAVLIALLAAFFKMLNRADGFSLWNFVAEFASWLLSVVVLYGVARLMRGKATFSATLRAVGFAQSVYILDLLGFIPVIGNMARLLATLVGFFGTWVGTATAHELRGLRTLLLPVLYVVIVVVGFVFMLNVLEGSAFAIQGILTQLGWTPQP